MKKINPNQICSIKIYINQLNTWFKYFDKKGNFFRKARSGYIDKMCDEVADVETILSDKRCFIKDNCVYYKPHIKLFLTDSSSEIIWFDSENDLDEFLKQDVIKKLNLINID